MIMLRIIVAAFTVTTFFSFAVTKEDIYKQMDAQRNKILDLRCLRLFSHSVSTNILITEYVAKGQYLVKISDMSLEKNIAYITKEFTYVKRLSGIITTNVNKDKLYNSFETPFNYNLQDIEQTHRVDGVIEKNASGGYTIQYISKSFEQRSAYKITINASTYMIEEVVEYFQGRPLQTMKYKNAQIAPDIYCHVGIDTIVHGLNASTHWDFKNISINNRLSDSQVTVQ